MSRVSYVCYIFSNGFVPFRRTLAIGVLPRDADACISLSCSILALQNNPVTGEILWTGDRDPVRQPASLFSPRLSSVPSFRFACHLSPLCQRSHYTPFLTCFLISFPDLANFPVLPQQQDGADRRRLRAGRHYRPHGERCGVHLEDAVSLEPLTTSFQRTNSVPHQHDLLGTRPSLRRSGRQCHRQ